MYRGQFHLKVSFVFPDTDGQFLLEVVNSLVECLESPVQVQRVHVLEHGLVLVIRLGQFLSQDVLQGEEVVMLKDNGCQIHLKIEMKSRNLVGGSHC